MEKIKKSKKKIIIAIIVILILVFVISSFFKKEEVAEPEFDTVAIEKQTLTTTISSTGKITTENSKNVTSQLMNYKITGVNVKVGDTVNVGDVLCTFDTADLAKTVSDLQATVNATNTGSHETILAAERTVQDAERSRNSTLDGLKQQADLARQEYDNHNTPLNNSKADLTNKQNEISNLQNQVASLSNGVNLAKTAVDTATIDRNTAKAAYDSAEAKVNGIQASLDAANADPSQAGLVGGLQIELDIAKRESVAKKQELDAKEQVLSAKTNEYNTQNKNLQEVTGKISSLQADITKLSATIPAQEQAVNALRDAYNKAQKAYDDTAATLNNQVANAQGQLESARAQTSVSTLTVQEQITAYQKQLADTNLKSTVAGTVTAVTAKAGDYYTGGSLVTIEGAESFIVESEIDEYDIADVKVGMEVSIKTDATRDEILEGQVISVAPAATSSVASSAMGMSSMTGATSSGSATYTVKVAINTQNDRLRLGMNSKINIITKKSENVLAVPYDAVTEKEDGSKIVTLIKEDNSEEEVPVTVGLESGYYTEISSDKLKEGLKVKIPKVSGGGIDDLLNSMGATAGM